MICRLLPALIAAALWCSSAGAAIGEELTEDDLVYTAERALWRQVDGQDEPALVAQLGVPAELVRRIRASVDGTALLLDVDGFVAWIDLTAPAPTSPRFLPCSTPAHMSADGHRVVCGAPDGKRTVVYTLRPSLSHSFLDLPADGARFGGEAGTAVVVLGASGVLEAQSRRVLAPHRPDAGFLVAPSGKRAAGVYLEREGEDFELGVLYTFRLDGKGARRKLIAPAEPLGFSRDSRWIIVQSDRRACVVRAVGGEYKCWKGFRALAGSTHGRALLVSRPSDQEGRIDVYRASLDGPRSRPPRLIREGVLGTAAFIPPQTSAAPPAAPPAP